MYLYKAHLLPITLIICFSCTSKMFSENLLDIHKIKIYSLQNINYCYPNIMIGTKESELLKILGKPKGKSNIEGMGLYLYDKCTLGFNTSYQDIDGDEKITSFHYPIDISFNEIIKEFGDKYELHSFPEYDTFLLTYKIDVGLFNRPR